MHSATYYKFFLHPNVLSPFVFLELLLDKPMQSDNPIIYCLSDRLQILENRSIFFKFLIITKYLFVSHCQYLLREDVLYEMLEKKIIL